MSLPPSQRGAPLRLEGERGVRMSNLSRRDSTFYERGNDAESAVCAMVDRVIAAKIGLFWFPSRKIVACCGKILCNHMRIINKMGVQGTSFPGGRV